jgi:hypothetical protein
MPSILHPAYAVLAGEVAADCIQPLHIGTLVGDVPVDGLSVGPTPEAVVTDTREVIGVMLNVMSREHGVHSAIGVNVPYDVAGEEMGAGGHCQSPSASRAAANASRSAEWSTQSRQGGEM